MARVWDSFRDKPRQNPRRIMGHAQVNFHGVPYKKKLRVPFVAVAAKPETSSRFQPVPGASALLLPVLQAAAA